MLYYIESTGTYIGYNRYVHMTPKRLVSVPIPHSSANLIFVHHEHDHEGAWRIRV